jgi:hypothetical protein
MCIEKGEVQTKDIANIINKIVAESFTNLEKERVIQVGTGDVRTLDRQDKKRSTSRQLKH